MCTLCVCVCVHACVISRMHPPHLAHFAKIINLVCKLMNYHQRTSRCQMTFDTAHKRPYHGQNNRENQQEAVCSQEAGPSRVHNSLSTKYSAAYSLGHSKSKQYQLPLVAIYVASLYVCTCVRVQLYISVCAFVRNCCVYFLFSTSRK